MKSMKTLIEIRENFHEKHENMLKHENLDIYIYVYGNALIFVLVAKSVRRLNMKNLEYIYIYMKMLEKQENLEKLKVKSDKIR